MQFVLSPNTVLGAALFRTSCYFGSMLVQWFLFGATVIKVII